MGDFGIKLPISDNILDVWSELFHAGGLTPHKNFYCCRYIIVSFNCD